MVSQTAQDPAQQPTAESSGLGPAAPGLVPAVGQVRADRVGAAVRTWQRHLVDLGGRNTLLWYRDLPSGTLDLTTAHPGGMAMLLAGRPTKLSDLVREPTALQEARRRVRAIRAKILELHEERGIAAGYIAVGMATWQVAGSSRPPCAPVLLRSCVLKPIGAAQQDFDIDLGQDVELNPVLEHYLRSEQGIELDPEVLEEMATFTKGFDPQPVYAALDRMCHSVPAFQIAPRLVLGTFSYAKLPMVADLAAQLATLASHDVVAALAGDPGALKAVGDTVPDFPADADPSREHLVLDADSCQQAVIDAVRWGANLVVKGPPGTGKSQTIANLIACLASQGKRTLFVAEKRAAIEAVTGRLERLGLGDLVLDVHDGATNKRRLAQELGGAMDRAKQAHDPDLAGIERTVIERRARLMKHRAALHDKRDPWGVSAFDAQVALARLWARRSPPISRVRLPEDVLQGISRDRVTKLSHCLTEAASLGAWTAGEAADDPWYGARVTSSDEASQALEIADRLGGEGMEAVRQRLGAAMREVGLPDATTPADWGRALNILEQVRQTLEIFRVEVFDAALADMVGATASKDYRDANGIRMGVWSRLRLRRQARGLLRPGTPPDDLHSALRDAQEQQVMWVQLAGTAGRPGVPSEIDEVQNTYDALADDLGWLGARLATTVAGGDLLGTPLAALQDRCAALARGRDRLAVLPRVVALIDELRGSGMGLLVDDLAARGVAPIDVGPEMDFVWWTSLLDEVSARDSAYGAHDGELLRRVGSEYIEADHAHLAATVDGVRAAVGRRLREVLDDHPEQEALVRTEAGKSRRHRPLRELMPRAGQTLTAIKPCWAMSPLVVASVLPPGRWFDVVIFDEASQIPPAQAVSAISRATQVVVAGDEHQLPPSSFSIAAVDEDGAADAAAGSLAGRSESILEVLSAALPIRRLTWHYRSLDERLVSFANAQMYDGALVTFPGTNDETVVRLEVVDGSAPVQPGLEAIESTRAEVDRVVQLVLSHARRRPNESLGVIALGVTHATRIEDALRGALSDGRATGWGDYFDQNRAERFFVKSLDRVQGDERDAIILSIGYGKTPHGRVLHRFGALNLDGGERHLNVAITRARRRMTVVSSFTAADLDPDRLKTRGALMLRDFLLYAAQGGDEPAPQPPISAEQGGPDAGVHPQGPRTQLDPLVADLAFRLRAEGLVVHTGYGTSAQRLDLAVEDPQRPGRVLVAVETDGVRYAAMLSTRDRDRLRVEQLRRLGWEHVRVWSTDLFRDPARDVARVVAAVRSASAARPADPQPADPQPAAASPAVCLPGSKPEQTRDDTDAGWGERPDDQAQDQWLRDQRPPHWG